MASFKKLSLGSLCNFGPTNEKVDGRWLWASGGDAKSIEEATKRAGLKGFPVGEQTFWGVPFAIADPATSGGKCWLILGDDAHPSLSRQSRFPVKGKAGYVVFCHTTDDQPSQHGNILPENLGEVLAEYTLILADGTRATQPIRRRFEINHHRHAWGQLAFAALAHPQHEPYLKLEAIRAGLTGLAGGHYAEPKYWLYAMPNPKPGVAIEEIELSSTGKGIVVVAGITLAQDSENPLQRSPRTAVRIDLTEPSDAPYDVEVSLDVGRVIKATPITDERSDIWVEEGVKGWGAESIPSPKRGPTYIEASAADSADLTVKTAQGRSSVRWGEVLRKGEAESHDRKVRVQVIHPRSTWVHAKVVDEATGKPIAARVHFSGRHGQYIAPYGHQSDINPNWCEDVGGDLVLGRMSYAYIPGSFQIELPVGDVYAEVVKGFEYTPVRKKLSIAPGQRELAIPIKHWADMKAQGYYSGDTHVHFVNPTCSVLEAGGEDLNVTNVLASQWGRLFTDVENFTGGLSPDSTDNHLVYVSQENRHHLLGHISLLGLKRPVYPLCSGGPDEDWLGGWEEVTMAEWMDACHEQGGLVVAPHFPNPHCELAADIALGKVDAAEIRYFDAMMDTYNITEWYRYLNCGYRLPAVGGTDKMFNNMPVGGVRTYARVDRNEPFNYDAWCRAIKAGRTFTTSGPIISLSVEGREMGDAINLPSGGGTVEIEAEASCAQPFDKLQIVVNGRVVAEANTDGGKKRASLKIRHSIKESCWVAARCFGKGQVWHVWPVAIYAHTSPVYLIVGGQEIFSPNEATYLLTLIEGGIAYLRHISIHRSEEKMHEHIALFERGREAIHRKLHEHGVRH